VRIAILTSRLVAGAILVGALAGGLGACSGDDSALIPTTTTVPEDPAVVAKERMCDFFQQYVTAEGRRVTSAVEDASMVTRLEQARSQALQGLMSSLTPEVPTGVRDALGQLQGLAIVAGPDPTTPPPVVDTATPLQVVTTSLDPVCGTKATTSSTTSATPASTASSTAASPTTASS
jgi:hypothetical protein